MPKGDLKDHGGAGGGIESKFSVQLRTKQLAVCSISQICKVRTAKRLYKILGIIINKLVSAKKIPLKSKIINEKLTYVYAFIFQADFKIVWNISQEKSV